MSSKQQLQSIRVNTQYSFHTSENHPPGPRPFFFHPVTADARHVSPAIWRQYFCSDEKHLRRWWL